MDSSNPDSLAVLSSALNQTLIETGRFFRSRGSLQSTSRLKKTMPVTRNQFNMALDDLSEQIFMAKAFLERDLDALKTENAPESVPEVTMGEAEAATKPEPEPIPEPAPEVKPDTEKAEQKSKPKPKPEMPTQPPEITTTTQTQPTPIAAESAIPTTDINFDSVLNDTTGGPNDFDLHLDFDGGLGDQNFLSGPGMGGIEEQPASTVDLSGGNEPRNSGLGGDVFDAELQKTQDDTNIGGQQQSEDMLPGESSFDDLFMANESLGKGVGDTEFLEGDELMNLNELDDNWFT